MSKRVWFIEASNPVSSDWCKRFYILSILDDVLEDRSLLFESIVQFLSFGPSTFRHLDRWLYDLGPSIYSVRPVLDRIILAVPAGQFNFMGRSFWLTNVHFDSWAFILTLGRPFWLTNVHFDSWAFVLTHDRSFTLNKN